MVKIITQNFNENDLGKAQLRKLNSLRKSLATDIANRAFGEWIKNKPSSPSRTP